MARVVSKFDKDMSGTRVGSYKIIRLLGQGGAGTVYLAKNEETGALEALKMLTTSLVGSVEAKERFEREIENIRFLKHPNIVKFCCFGEAHDICFYTMEFCKGGNAKDLVAQSGGRLPEALACRIMSQVLDGLEYAHNAPIPHVKMKDGSWGSGCGLVHRDIKPENILLKERSEIGNTEPGMWDKPGTGTGEAGRRKGPQVKISDFGLSKTYRSADKCGNTQTGSVGGSLAFICRQQILNFKYSRPEVDVWSAAAVLYFLLTGVPPRNLGNEKNPFNAILKNSPVPIKKVLPSISEGLASVIDRALDDSGILFFKSPSDLREGIAKLY